MHSFLLPDRSGDRRPRLDRWLMTLAGVAVAILAAGPAVAAVARPTPPPWLHQTPSELRQATFDLFARHGRSFADPDWQAYYNRQPWYHADPAYRDQRLTLDERWALRQILRQRLALAKTGDKVDRPLWQDETSSLTLPIPDDWQPLLMFAGLNLACIVIFIVWRKGRIPALLGFIATTVMVIRQINTLDARPGQTDPDAAYAVRDAITAVSPEGRGLALTVGGQVYHYDGRFPFRVGEIVTLEVSAHGRVLLANGIRVHGPSGSANADLGRVN